MFIPNAQNDNAKFYLIDFTTSAETIRFTSCDRNVVFNGQIYKNCQFIDDISFNDLDKIDDVKIQFVNKDNIEIERFSRLIVQSGRTLSAAFGKNPGQRLAGACKN